MHALSVIPVNPKENCFDRYFNGEIQCEFESQLRDATVEE
jgi:hypothetical protein